MSRRSNIRKRIRQRQKHNRSSRKLAASTNPITGESQSAFQLPIRSDFKRVSTASLIEEIQRRPEAQALLAAIAEANAQSEDHN
jgi:hypothetical protein